MSFLSFDDFERSKGAISRIGNLVIRFFAARRLRVLNGSGRMAARVLLDNWSQRTCALKSLTATKFEVKFENSMQVAPFGDFFSQPSGFQ